MEEHHHDGYQGEERRRMPISSEQLEIIANKAAEKALQNVYAEVGKSVLKKLAWLIGIVLVGLAMWLTGKGYTT